MSEEDLAAVNLQTMLGVQQALAKLGLDPGTIDGFDGPHTRAAVKQFQEGVGITADGVVGPVTREKLADALRDIAHRGDDVGRENGADGGS
jgi:peptidoglycan hydrolase-like protein with peptidoglycan-binding domain